ncbi:MAG: hypothetical protein GJ676_21720 [Rhodobacteraceae bacterium]|nr:hypothetical protein [Paracoccaceae bacterium]
MLGGIIFSLTALGLLWAFDDDDGLETIPVEDPDDDTGMMPDPDPTTDPTIDPITDPTTDPSTDPTASPTPDPTSDPTTDPTTPPTTDPTAGVILAYDGNPVLTGTAGNDTLAPSNGDPLALDLERVDLLAGDDTAEIDTATGVTLDGGPGNDTLTSLMPGNTLTGGDGDDTLVGGAATTINGGNGDDTVSIDLTTELNDSFTAVDGGAGDDELTITSAIGSDLPDFSSAQLVGDTGEDDFNVLFELSEPNPAFPIDDPVETPSGVVISDFDPAEDTLTVEIEAQPGSETRSLDSTTLEDVSTTATDGTVTTHQQLVLTFTDSGTAPDIVTRISLRGSEPVTLDDIMVLYS